MSLLNTDQYRNAGVGQLDPHSSQALIAETGTNVRLRRRPTHADPGWYPDPARTGKIRFYDGRGWTARTRIPLAARKRKLPAAALALRARILAVEDARAAKSQAGQIWRTQRVRVAKAAALPSMQLAVRTRAGRVGGMVSIMVLLTGLTFALLVGWQHGGTALLEAHAQKEMRADMEKTFGKEFTTYDSSDPTPIAVPETVTDPAAPTPPPANTPTDQPSSKPAPKTSSNTKPTLVRPPADWAPPANRKYRSVTGFRNSSPIGRIAIPRIGLDQILVSGTGNNALAKGIGVAKWGVLPGTPGNAVVAGHRVSHGSKLRDVHKLRYGDQIIVDIPGQGRAVYEVRGNKVVRPWHMDAVKQTKGVRLTLTTCHPPGSVGHRYIVQAELVSGDWLDKAYARKGWKLS